MTRENTVNVPKEPTEAMLEAFYGAVEILPTGTIRGFLSGWEAMLSAADLHKGEGEPVAWRYRYPNDPTWQLTLDRKQAHDKTGEAEPLYAAPPPSVEVFGSSAEGADTHRDADGAVLADGRDVSGETVMGMRVAAYRHPIDCPAGTDRVAWNDFFRGEPPNTYSEHWSTPGAHRKDVERLFTEADIRARFAAQPQSATSVSPGTSVASEPNPSVEVEGLREALEKIKRADIHSEGNDLDNYDPAVGHLSRAWLGPLGRIAAAALSRKQEPGGETDLDDLLKQSVEAFKSLPPEERRRVIAAQRASYVRGMTTPCEHGVLDFEQCGECRVVPTPGGEGE